MALALCKSCDVLRVESQSSPMFLRSDHADQQYFHIYIKAETVYDIDIYQNDNIQLIKE